MKWQGKFAKKTKATTGGGPSAMGRSTRREARKVYRFLETGGPPATGISDDEASSEDRALLPAATGTGHERRLGRSPGGESL